MSVLPRKWRRAVSARESVSDDDFFDRFYSDSRISRETVCEIRAFIACEYSIQSDKLLPSDRFSEELSAERFWDWDSGYAILGHALDDAARENGVFFDRGFESVDDYIRLMAQVYQKRGFGRRPPQQSQLSERTVPWFTIEWAPYWGPITVVGAESET